MRRRHFIALLLSATPLARGGELRESSRRGRLVETPDGKPALELAGKKLLHLEGDDATAAVLKDKRLSGADIEVIGHPADPDRFIVDPIHTKAMFVHKNGERLYITYWCDVCYIRTYAPGVCWCCQKYTDLDLRGESER